MAIRKTTSVTASRRQQPGSGLRSANSNKRTLRGAAPIKSIWQWIGLSQAKSVFIIFLILGLVVSGLSVVLTTHKSRLAFIELQRSKEQANSLNVQWGQLLIEQSTFGLEGRIEQKATNHLKMQTPELSRIVMVTHD